MARIFKIGFSFCPNDTFIFDALVNGKIDQPNYRFEVTVADIEELNRLASGSLLDIVKVSYAHLPAILDKYVALRAGGAMGFNCGPVIVARDKDVLGDPGIVLVAIPGEFTTAAFLMKKFFPEVTRKRVMLFSEIEDSVLAGEVDAGLLIHESRFTFEEKGLKKIADLGELWHAETNLPLPLGCIAVRRDLPILELSRINSLLRQSVLLAMENPQQTMAYVKKYAATLNERVILQHIGLYVNKYSADVGERGKTAAGLLLKDIVPKDAPLFFDDVLN